jgi:outer membrane biosynthesis protein TonB
LPQGSKPQCSQAIFSAAFLRLADGKVRDVTPLVRLGYGLDESAVKAVQSWKFGPALRDGSAIDFKTALAVEFAPRTN